MCLRASENEDAVSDQSMRNEAQLPENNDDTVSGTVVSKEPETPEASGEAALANKNTAHSNNTASSDQEENQNAEMTASVSLPSFPAENTEAYHKFKQNIDAFRSSLEAMQGTETFADSASGRLGKLQDLERKKFENNFLRKER